MTLNVATLTDTGRARPHNEDSLDYHLPQDPNIINTKGGIYLVADGMGGHQAGEVASREAINLVIDQYYSDLTHDVGTSLVRAYKAANQLIYEEAQSDLAKAGMGTTLVAAVIVGRKVHIASVGDSRVYLIGQAGIVQITEDHSWVQEQIRAGYLTREQARLHPQRNVVTRALGSKPSVEVDLFEGHLADGDALLLCSDGLSGLVEDWEIEAIVREQPAQDAVKALVAKANERGGTDNISVLIVDTRPEVKGQAPTVAALPPTLSGRERKSRTVPLLAGAAAAIVALLLVGILLVRPLLKGQPTATVTAGAAAVTAYPGASASPLLTSTLSPSPSGEGSDQGGTPLPPTVTLIPTRTPTPIVTPRPSPTKSPAATSTSTATLALPSVQLLEPNEQQGQSVTGKVLFRWTYSQPLAEGQAFQVLIWKDNTKDHLGAAEATVNTEQLIDLDVVLPPRGGPGTYWWTVVVVNSSTEERLSPEADPWRLVYTGLHASPEPSAGPVGLPTITVVVPLPKP